LINRELSWLDFAARVLELATEEHRALMERVKFLAIFSQGLDEFFQVRVAGLKDQLAAGVRTASPDGMTPAEALRAIRTRVVELVEWQSRIFTESVAPALTAAGVRLSGWERLDSGDKGFLVAAFERAIFPVLTPLAVDPGHPFPYISNLSMNLAVLVSDPVKGETRFARVKVPPLLPRFVVLPDGERFVPLEQVIAVQLPALFPGMVIGEHKAFRVTRNADLALEEDGADDLLEAVEDELRRRRFGRAVRLEVDAGTSQEIRSLLARELELDPGDCYEIPTVIDLGGLWAVYGLDRPDLHEPPIAPVTLRWGGLSEDRASGAPAGNAFGVLDRGDVLVQHPYESFAGSVEEFVRQAADDPDVLAIKQTLYRTSAQSRVVAALIHAAEMGKQVAAVVELKARFDEQANIARARALEEAGVHVVYGLAGLKTHAKSTLVVRKEGDGVREYCHLGTGNYNEGTARSYEDLGLFTADPVITGDVLALFNFLTGYSRYEGYRSLLVAPVNLRARLLDHIEAEGAAGEDGYITIKCNGLTDPEIIEALYEASQAGATVALVVRSICCLRPGLAGVSERITVRSVVGRFLEHSRIYRFGRRTAVDHALFGAGLGEVPSVGAPGAPSAASSSAPGSASGASARGGSAPGASARGGSAPGASASGSARPSHYYIGSADLMERNLDRRVEVLAPVASPELRERLDAILALSLADDSLTWVLGPDGGWERISGERNVNMQAILAVQARQRAREHWERESALTGVDPALPLAELSISASRASARSGG